MQLRTDKRWLVGAGMNMDVNWLDIIELYLLICFTYLYFYQKRRALDMQKQIDALQTRIDATGSANENSQRE